MSNVLISIDHPIISDNQTSQITARAVKGSSSIEVQNDTGFDNDSFIVVGTYKSESAEISMVSSTSNNVITLDASYYLDNDHADGEHITIIGYDQIQIYRSTDSGETYALLTTVDITPDRDKTYYTDTSGASTYYYKTRYYNSNSTATSDYSAEFVGSGPDYDTVSYMIDEVYREIQDPDHVTITRTEIMNILSAGERRIWKRKRRWNDLITDADLVTVASTDTIDLPTDFDKPYQDPLYEYDSDSDDTADTKYRLREISQIRMDELKEDMDADDDDALQFYCLDLVNSKLRLYPTPETADLAITLPYFKKPTRFTAESDTSVFSQPDALIFYAAYIILKRRKKFDSASAAQNDFEELVSTMIRTDNKNAHPRGFKYNPNYNIGYYKN